jgi:acyl-CoA thioesterase-1
MDIKSYKLSKNYTDDEVTRIVNRETDSDAMSRQAAVNTSGVDKLNLKARIDDDYNYVAAQLVNTATELQKKRGFHTSKLVGKLKNGENAKIVFLGDSTTEQNATTNGQPNSVGLLTTWLQSQYPSQLTVINSGISGNSIVQMKDRLSKDVLAHNPDLVVICSGINDAIGTNNITLEKYRADYNQVIRAIISYNNPDIIIRTPNVLINPASNTTMVPFIEASKAIAARYNLGLYDLYAQMAIDIENGTISLTVPAFMQDGIHPNENGHLYIFDSFKPFFEPTDMVVKPVDNYKMINGSAGFLLRNTAAVESVNANALNGKLLSFSVTGRYIETEFIGGSFSVVYAGSTGTGQFVVYIDGVAQPLEDTFRAVTAYGQYVLYQVPNGRHNIRIENQATKNASSTGNLLMIEGIVFNRQQSLNDIIKPYEFALVAQTASVTLTPSSDSTFIFNSVTDNADIIDQNLTTGDITVKKSGLYQLSFTTRIIGDPDSVVTVKYQKNTVVQKSVIRNLPSSVGSKTETVDLFAMIELVAGDVIKFTIQATGAAPTTVAATTNLSITRVA